MKLYAVRYEVRKSGSDVGVGDSLPRLGIRSNEGRSFRARHWGNTVLTGLIEVRLVAHRDALELERGLGMTAVIEPGKDQEVPAAELNEEQAKILSKYVQDRGEDDEGSPNFYLNNQSYAVTFNPETAQYEYTLITDGRIAEINNKEIPRSTVEIETDSVGFTNSAKALGRVSSDALSSSDPSAN